MINYIIWDVAPEIIEGFRVRWYGLFFALGFYLSYTILVKIFKHEGLSQKSADNFTFQTFILLILGLRLGHCLFYEPAEYLADPIRILFIWEGGLASHGGAIGLLVSFFMFTRKNAKSFIWIMSRAAVVIPFTAAMVRLGNLMNSEIYGVATQIPWAFVFVRDSIVSVTPQQLTDVLTQGGLVNSNMSSQLLLFLQQYAQHLQAGLPLEDLQELLVKINVLQSDSFPKLTNVLLQAKLLTSNHPTQLYEAFVYLMVFGGLMWYYFKNTKLNKPISDWLILAVIFTVIFGARFIIEFIKNDQVDFENTMALNMGQLLSIPFILFGLFSFYKHVMPHAERCE